MQFSKLLVFFAAVTATAFAANLYPSGQGIIQLQNGTDVYGCVNSDVLFISTEGSDDNNSECNVFTANGTIGVIGWDGVYLGIPQDSYPQPLLFFNYEDEALQWIFAPDSDLPGLLFVKGLGAAYNTWMSELVPAPGGAQAIYYFLGAPVTPFSAFFVWVPQ